MLLRAARPDEATVLSDLALRSKAHWGYDKAFLESCRAELTLQPEELAVQRATVAEVDGQVVGFYTLAGEPPAAELAFLYIEPDHIGGGIGRRLWQHAVDTARKHGIERFTIDAEPAAETFYRKMGATQIGSVTSGSIPGRMLPQMIYRVV